MEHRHRSVVGRHPNCCPLPGRRRRFRPVPHRGAARTRRRRHAVEIDDQAPTGLYVKELVARADGAVDGTMHYYRAGSAAAAMSPETLAAPVASTLLARAALVHTSGITPAISASALAAQEALYSDHRPGRLVSFDLNWRPALWRGREAEGREIVSGFARRADIVFCTRPDAEAVFGTSDPQELRALFPQPRYWRSPTPAGPSPSTAKSVPRATRSMPRSWRPSARETRSLQVSSPGADRVVAHRERRPRAPHRDPRAPQHPRPRRLSRTPRGGELLVGRRSPGFLRPTRRMPPHTGRRARGVRCGVGAREPRRGCAAERRPPVRRGAARHGRTARRPERAGRCGSTSPPSGTATRARA